MKGNEVEMTDMEFIENAPDGFFVADAEGSYQHVNRAACEITGYSREELLNLKIQDLIFKSDQEKAKEHFKQVSENGTATDTLRYVKKNNEVSHWVVKAFRNTTNKTPQLYAYVKDIGESRYFQNLEKIDSILNQALTNKESFSELVVEMGKTLNCTLSWLINPCTTEHQNYSVMAMYNKKAQPDNTLPTSPLPKPELSNNLMMKVCNSADPIVEYTFEGLGSDTPLSQRNGLEAIMLIKVSTKLNQPWLLGFQQKEEVYRWSKSNIRYVSEVAKKLANAIDNLTLINNLQASEEKVRKYSDDLEANVNKRTEELEAQATRLSESQKALTYLLEDMNEARNKLLFANEELDTLNQELESFSYSVSHDLRAPLTRLDGFSRALTDHLEGKLDDTAKHYLDRIRLSSQHMGNLIKDLLTLSRINRRELLKREIDISKLASNILTEITESEKTRQAEISIADNIFVNADKTLMEFMLRNLIENAWKFTRKRELTKIEIGQGEKNGTTHVYIKDNGIGFNMKYYDQLFAVFRRLHSNKEFTGTGIGLATVQRIVNRHKGSIWAESIEDEGSTFFFSI